MKNKAKVRLFIISFLLQSLFCVSTVYAERIDSLEKALDQNSQRDQVILYYELAREYYSSGMRDEAMDAVERGKSLATRFNDDKGLIKILTYEGLMYQSIGNLNLSIEMLNEAIELGKQNDKLKVSLIEAMNHQSVNYFRKQEIDTMYDNAQEALLVAESMEEEDVRSAKAETYNHLGLASYYKGELFEALSQWQKELNLRKELDDLVKLAQAYGNIGVIYRTQGDYKSALEYYQENLKIVEETGNKMLIARAKANVGNIYYSIGMEYSKALEYYNESLEDFIAINDSNNISNTYLNISSVFLADYVAMTRGKESLKEDDLAKEKIEMALEKGFQAMNYAIRDNNKAMAKRNLGSIYIAAGDYEKAIEYLDEAHSYFEGRNDIREIATTLNYLGESYYRIGDYDRSIEYYTRAEEYHKEIGHRRELYDLYKSLSDVYLAKDNCQRALAYFKSYAELKDSTLSERYLDALRGYEHMQSEREIALLNEKSARQQAENRRQRMMLISMVLIFFLVLGFSLVIVKQYNDKRRANVRLEEQNILLEERNNEIQLQRDQIFHQNEEITASITYASRIQQAILPPKDSFVSVPDHFILFKPRDIVSGDFYWIHEREDTIGWMAADCTGHGVPGAFMSMLGTAFLNEIVSTMKKLDSAAILDELKANVIKSLHQTGEVGTSQDGMDVALCLLDKKTKKLQFSGAYNALILIRNGELSEIKADKMPIGVAKDKRNHFSKEEFIVQEGDCLYVFSDGYVDQFGGEKGKKFMKKRFKDLLLEIHDKPMQEQQKILDKEFLEWIGTDYEQIDDVIVIGVKI